MEEAGGYRLTLTDVADERERALVHDGLRAFNDAASAHHRDAHAGVHPMVPLDVYLRGNGEMISGGITASTFWGWLEVEHLWVDETLRGHGFGRRLLLAAEAEARRRGCNHSYLTT